MRNFSIFLLLAMISGQTLCLAADSGCKKCEIMREYHKNHPSKYQYYDDYMKDLEEKGVSADEINDEDLPSDVKYIINQSSDVKPKTQNNK